ncbi:MAG: hypothetical protein COV45_02275 [Deltaproteobacteria bacterium CG11_big_fil_rev_8_21_14_0_20_47_16]|nr:MAG: hypothetical protein COV45_02275 [Deltaproteobacteria bacterium CG11_big_fil_rev_8_21_14_0_20_47_16]
MTRGDMSDAKSNHWKWLLFIVTIIFVTRATTFIQPLIDDEEAFSAFARVLLHGGIPYVTIIDNKPPILYYIYAACLWLFGESNTVSIHIMGILCTCAICWYLFKIGSRIFSVRSGYWAALSFAIFSTCYIPPTLAVHASLLIALPLTCSVWCLIQWYDHKSLIWIVFCGMLCAFAIFIKYQAFIQIPFVVWAIAYLHFRKFNDSWFKTAVVLTCFGLGLGIVTGITLGWMAHINALKPMLNQTLRASVSYIKDGENIGSYWRRASIQIGSYVAATFPLWLGLIHQLTHRAKNYLNAEPIARPLPTWIWGWFFFTIPAIVAGGRFYGHYFIQILPPLCIIAGTCFNQWWSRSTKTRWAMSCTFIILTAGWMGPRIWYQSWADHFHLQNLKVEMKIANYLKLNMAPNDTLFIWGTEPGLYFLSEHQPATRFLWVDALTGRLPGIKETQKGSTDTSAYIGPNSWHLFWQDMNTHPPRYIIDCASGNLRDYAKFPIRNYPELYDYITRNYNLETTIDGVNIYRQKKS